MTQPAYRHLQSRTEQDVLVMTLTEPQIRGDELADELRQELLAAVEQAGLTKVVLDFHAVEYISSVAFRPLLQLHAHLKDRGRVVLCQLAEAVAQVLQLTRLISTSRTSQAPFEEQSDVAAAIASLGQKRPA